MLMALLAGQLGQQSNLSLVAKSPEHDQKLLNLTAPSNPNRKGNPSQWQEAKQ
jgi:hypothetical protein